MICGICRCEIGDKAFTDLGESCEDGDVTHTWRDDCIAALQARIDALEKENKELQNTHLVDELSTRLTYYRDGGLETIPADILKTVIYSLNWQKANGDDNRSEEFHRALDYFTGGK
jgi:hypothetical protein